MNKRFYIFIPILCVILSGNAYAGCAPTNCKNGGDTGKGWSIIDAYGRRGTNGATTIMNAAKEQHYLYSNQTHKTMK